MRRKAEWKENNREIRSETLSLEVSVLIGPPNVARYFQNRYFILEFAASKAWICY